ncbi:hypothetical protein ACJMK2_007235 [Sinanodonta woodiana]|uniref:Uncharacterized protein n=1 Tax=Sinanodonta woodiana TaxID=1069815 RepID=A0ABD3VHW6_SINWO
MYQMLFGDNYTEYALYNKNDQHMFNQGIVVHAEFNEARNADISSMEETHENTKHHLSVELCNHGSSESLPIDTGQSLLFSETEIQYSLTKTNEFIINNIIHEYYLDHVDISVEKAISNGVGFVKMKTIWHTENM